MWTVFKLITSRNHFFVLTKIPRRQAKQNIRTKVNKKIKQISQRSPVKTNEYAKNNMKLSYLKKIVNLIFKFKKKSPLL